MKKAPETLTTQRLVLQKLSLADAPEIQRMAGDAAVAKTTLNIPHPYPEGGAVAFIQNTHQRFEQGKSYAYGVYLKEKKTLVGVMELIVYSNDHRGELGYWFGKEHWNHGYGTEAAGAVIAMGFEVLNLQRIFASHISSNIGSLRIMEKNGLQYEGTWRQHRINRMDGTSYLDIDFRGILAEEYFQQKENSLES